jgi:hypothetical protein
MKVKTKIQINKLLLILACLSFLIATAEGFLYYSSYENLFFRVLLVLQNSIKAFSFRASIDIGSVFSNIQQKPDLIHVVVGYTYAAAVFIAPFCTFATVYYVLERVLTFVLRLPGWKDDREDVVIFGYHEDVSTLLEDQWKKSQKSGEKRRSSSGYKQRIHVVSAKELSREDRYHLQKMGILVHEINFMQASAPELHTLFEHVGLKKAQRVLLFEESSIDNFSLLQMLLTVDEKHGALIQSSAKVFCRCENESVRQMIESYYDHCLSENDSPARSLDLEIISLPELQVRAMYENYSLHTRFLESDLPPKDWGVHLLIIGFGQLGQQALLQALNLGVAHSENSIRVDVVDYNIAETVGIFSNQFSEDTFTMEENHFFIPKERMDGRLDINFYQMNVQYKSFQALLKKISSGDPFTYVVIALENLEVSMHCLSELMRNFQENKAHYPIHIPVMVRMDSNQRLASFIEENEENYPGAHMIQGRLQALTLQNILAEQLDDEAKSVHDKYMMLSNQDISWKDLQLFGRNSSRASSCHHAVDQAVLKSAERSGEPFFDLLQITPEYQREDLIRDNMYDPFVLEMMKLEHRRWCYYMASIGWRHTDSEKNFQRKENPCLSTWAELENKYPEQCRNDLIPLLECVEKFSKDTKERNEKNGYTSVNQGV